MKAQNSNGIMSNNDQCAHSHRHSSRKKAAEFEEVIAPPSPIQEEPETDIEGHENASVTDELYERPRTGKSRQSSASVTSRPGSRMFGNRPESSRSVFESVPGTRPPSRRVGIFIFTVKLSQRHYWF